MGPISTVAERALASLSNVKFHRLSIESSRLYIGGVSVRDIVTAYGTPLYVLDAGIVRSQASTVRAALAGAVQTFFFSIKWDAGR